MRAQVARSGIDGLVLLFDPDGESWFFHAKQLLAVSF
jgi:hypothetical protein